MKHYIIFLLVLFAHLGIAQDKNASENFMVKPYLQIGRNPGPETLELLWHAQEGKDVWAVELKQGGRNTWKKNEMLNFKKVAVKGVKTHQIYFTTLKNLIPGSTFSYRIVKNRKIIFTADAQAPKASGQAYRFVAFGDCGAGTAEQKPLAFRAFMSKPDFVVLPGDMVYERGLISEYLTKFWPVYNADSANENGVPMMRSIPFFSAPGNHDIDTRDLNAYPDALAYFSFWNQPLNGPLGKEGGPLVPPLVASDSNRTAFITAAGDAYPRMANFSFNYNNAHWTIVDSNPYVDWTDKALLDWVANDLAAAKDATWKFVVFHHPGFNSAREHYEQQQMRLLSPILDAGKVDVVFNGHVHNYQRTYPMSFIPDKSGTLLIGGREGKTIRGRVVNGRWKLDKSYDGQTDTTPEGIIYVVTGAGGQKLYNPEQNDDPDSWQKFTHKFISNIHSITVADVDGKSMTIRQVSQDGTTLDSFKITK